MAYQLNYFEVIKALFLPVNISFLLLAIGIPTIIIFTVLYKTNPMGNKRYQWMIVVSVVLAPVAAMLFISQNNVGAGWCLKDDKLQIKAWPVETTIDLTLTQVALVDSSSSWKPVLRTNGYGTSGLETGWFKLQNGKNAVVFYHLTPSKILVLQSEGQYYLLAHPGVEELYRKIVKQEVSEIAQ